MLDVGQLTRQSDCDDAACAQYACLPHVLDLQVQLRFGLVSGWERKGWEEGFRLCIRRYLRSTLAVRYEEPPSEAVLSNYEDLKCNPNDFPQALLYPPAALHEEIPRSDVANQRHEP